MYELLIRIETICVEARPLTLLGVGLVTTVAGLLLWLAGMYFSSVIIGILGAVVGSFCGLLASQLLDVNPLLSMAVGAALLCIAAVLFRNIIIIVLAVIVFALASGTVYSSTILGTGPRQEDMQAEGPMFRSFSRMDPGSRLAYVDEISQEAEGFFERLKALLRDTLGAMDPYKWKLLLAALLGGIGGLVLIWLIKRLVLAVCCSGVGTLLVLIGIESMLMVGGVQLCSAFAEHRGVLTITYFSMVGLGTVVQLILMRSRKPKEAGRPKQQPED